MYKPFQIVEVAARQFSTDTNIPLMQVDAFESSIVLMSLKR